VTFGVGFMEAILRLAFHSLPQFVPPHSLDAAKKVATPDDAGSQSRRRRRHDAWSGNHTGGGGGGGASQTAEEVTGGNALGADHLAVDHALGTALHRHVLRNAHRFTSLDADGVFAPGGGKKTAVKTPAAKEAYQLLMRAFEAAAGGGSASHTTGGGGSRRVSNGGRGAGGGGDDDNATRVRGGSSGREGSGSHRAHVSYRAWMALCCRADLVVATGSEGYSREISPPPSGAHVDPLTGRLSVASATAIFLESTDADDAHRVGVAGAAIRAHAAASWMGGGGGRGRMTFAPFVEGLARCGQALYGSGVSAGGGGVGGSHINQWVHQVVKAHIGPNMVDGIEPGRGYPW
jgi:hypothetical protein